MNFLSLAFLNSDCMLLLCVTHQSLPQTLQCTTFLWCLRGLRHFLYYQPSTSLPFWFFVRMQEEACNLVLLTKMLVQLQKLYIQIYVGLPGSTASYGKHTQTHTFGNHTNLLTRPCKHFAVHPGEWLPRDY